MNRRAFLLAPLALAAARLATAMTTVGGLPPVFPIRVGDLHGLIDGQGRVLLPPEFAEVVPGSPLILATKAYKTAFFDYRGGMSIPPQTAITRPFREGLAPSLLADGAGKAKYGYVDAALKTAIRPEFDSAEAFADGLAVVGIADAWGAMKYGAVDLSGRLVVPAVHEKLLPPSGGVVRAETRDRAHRVFDRGGREITPEGIDFVGIAAEGMVRVWSGRKQGFMTTAGVLAVPPRFDMADEFSEGLARLMLNGKYGYVDTSGKLAIAARFATAEKFSDGWAPVREEDGGKTVFVDKTGKVVLRPVAERVYPFTEGLAVAKIGTRYGFIDKTGKLALEPRFSYARPFHAGLAYVTLGRAGGYIRPDGEFVWRGE